MSAVTQIIIIVVLVFIEANIPPWTLCAGEKGTWCVVELPAGRAGDWGLHDGDWVELF